MIELVLVIALFVTPLVLSTVVFTLIFSENGTKAERKELLTYAHELVAQHLGDKVRVPVRFGEPVGSAWPSVVAGQYDSREMSIVLNPKVLPYIGVRGMRDTVRHEVAHVIAHLRYGRHIDGHGSEWVTVAKELGAIPQETVTYN